MKKLCTLIFAVVTLTANAQTQESATTLTTYHTETFPTEVIAYRSKIDLSMVDNSYGGTFFNSLEEMEEEFFKKLKDKGLNPKDAQKDQMEFLQSGYNREGMTYIYTTTNKENIIKFMSVKMPNTYPRAIEYKLKDSDTDVQGVIKMALAKTREKADAVAREMGQKVKRIKDVSVQNSQSRKWTSYKDEAYIGLTVIYEVE